VDVVQLLISGVANGCVYGLIAMGFVLIYKATEAVNFAQGDLMMLGAFAALGLTNAEYLGLPFWLAVPLAALLMGAFAYALDAAVIRRLFGQPQITVAILTIALGFLLRFLAGALFGHEPQSLETPFAGRDIALGGVVLGLEDAVAIVATLALTGGLWLFFRRARLGVAMGAAAQSQLAALLMGIPVRRLQSLAWALAGATAAIAGVLHAAQGSIDPSSGLLGIKAFAAAVIGGMGSLPGALLGGLIVGVIEPFAGRFLPAGYSQIAPYLLLFAVLVVRPHGLLSQVQGKKV
jgi:branched-chain amino acid transport system permease protein